MNPLTHENTDPLKGVAFRGMIDLPGSTRPKGLVFDDGTIVEVRQGRVLTAQESLHAIDVQRRLREQARSEINTLDNVGGTTHDRAAAAFESAAGPAAYELPDFIKSSLEPAPQSEIEDELADVDLAHVEVPAVDA